MVGQSYTDATGLVRLIEIPAIKETHEINVLIIDDQALVHGVIKSALYELGIRNVRTAENAYYAVRLCNEHQFDIIIVAFNVKSDKDGFHLLEELKFKGHVTKSTAVIFLSAETDASLVNCVIELQPSDFWVKPLDNKKVISRLKHILAIKKKLYRLHYCMDMKEYASAIYIGERQLIDPALAQYYPHIDRLIGESLMHLMEYKDAEEFYRKLCDKYKFGWVRVALVSALLKQEKDEEAKELIEELKDRDDSKFLIYDLMAQYYIDHENYAQAYEEIKTATQLAPRNIERNKKSCTLARLNHDKMGQYIATQMMAKYAKNSIHDSPELAFNVIRAGIDLATSLSDGDSAKVMAKVDRQLMQMEDDYQGEDMAEQLAIIKIRMLNVRDDKKKAEKILKEEVKLKAGPSVEDNLDKVKAYHELGYREESMKLLDQIKEQIAGDTFSSKVVTEYIKQESLERKEIHFTPKELSDMATEHFKNKRYVPAYMDLSKAFTLSPTNKQLAMSLLKVLVVLKDQGKLDKQQTEHAQNAIEMLSTSKLPEDQQTKLVEYIDLLELKAEPEEETAEETKEE